MRSASPHWASFQPHRTELHMSSNGTYEISLCQERYTRSFPVKGDVWDILLFDRDTWYPHIKKWYMRYISIKRDMQDLSLYIQKGMWDMFYLREMYEISLSIWDISSSISLLNRDTRYLSLFWGVCERLLYLREMCEISLFKRKYMRYLSVKRDIWDISLSREIYEISFY